MVNESQPARQIIRRPLERIFSMSFKEIFGEERLVETDSERKPWKKSVHKRSNA
jgi:hypothetical protein